MNLGIEKIDGEDTQHLKVTQEEKGKITEFEAWYNADWDAVKYKDDKGEVTGIDAGFSGAGLQLLTHLYCNTVAIAEMIIDNEGNVDDFIYNYKGKRSTGESVDFGTGTPTQIDLYDIEDKLTHFDRLLGISKINGAQMFTVIETINEEAGTMEGMRITHAVPH